MQTRAHSGTRSSTDAAAGTETTAGAGQDGALTLVTVLIGPALVLCGLQLLGAAPWSSDGADPFAATTALLAEAGSGGARIAETLIGVLAAGLGAVLSLIATIAGCASVLVALCERCGAAVPRAVEAMAPRFMRRSVAVVLGAQVAVLGIGAPAAAAAPAEGPGVGSPAATAQETPGEDPADEGTTADAPAETDPAPLSSQTPNTPQDRAGQNEAGQHHAAQSEADRSDADQNHADQNDTGQNRADLNHTDQNQEAPVAPLFIPQAPEPAEDRHHQAQTRAEADAGETIAVRPGDTLWEIAAAELGPGATDWEIAEQWPRWHEANRALIGDDPSALQAGTVLERPSALHD